MSLRAERVFVVTLDQDHVLLKVRTRDHGVVPVFRFEADEAISLGTMLIEGARGLRCNASLDQETLTGEPSQPLYPSLGIGRAQPHQPGSTPGVTDRERGAA